MRNILKDKKAIAGLDVFLGVITMIFLLGLLIGIFVIMGSELQSSARTTGDTLTSTVLNETGSVNSTGYQLKQGIQAEGFRSYSVIAIQNVSAGQQGLYLTGTTGNWTINTSGWIRNATTATHGYYRANISYSYVWASGNVRLTTEIMNETKEAVGGAVDYFGIIITITAMVVLILLVIIIIRAIRGSGMIGGSEGYGGKESA